MLREADRVMARKGRCNAMQVLQLVALGETKIMRNTTNVPSSPLVLPGFLLPAFLLPASKGEKNYERSGGGVGLYVAVG